MSKVRNLDVTPIKENIITLDLVGDGDLILHKKSRLYEQSDVWKQNHPKGTELPERFKVKNPWEAFITTITWKNPIVFHDDDANLYCEDEWNDYMENNTPCILTKAFIESYKEAFITFFRESTGKHGTDFFRSLNIVGNKVPIEFTAVMRESKLVPNGKGRNATNVVCNQNVFSGWRTRIILSMPERVFPVETIVSIVQTAGKYLGVGSARGNGYGRYHIENAFLS